MTRPWIWLQLLIGWLPVGALFAALIVAMHPPTSIASATLVALRMTIAAAILGVGVERLTQRLPWPHPFRVSFVALQLVLALAFAVAWLVLISIIDSVVRGRLVIAIGPGVVPFIVLGVWIYVMVAGVSYTTRATERLARAEAYAATSQLAALRAQLNPHFLFNALHLVVQLIPTEPARASQAAEQVSELLRTAVEEDRDLVPMEDEIAFVTRYLQMQQLRFGDRLTASLDIPRESLRMLVPSFTLQALVENAVRHGAEPRVAPTEIRVTATIDARSLHLAVVDDGAGSPAGNGAGGTGLSRLRERLAVLYGDRATLHAAPLAPHGFAARLSLPATPADE